MFLVGLSVGWPLGGATRLFWYAPSACMAVLWFAFDCRAIAGSVFFEVSPALEIQICTTTIARPSLKAILLKVLVLARTPGPCGPVPDGRIIRTVYRPPPLAWWMAMLPMVLSKAELENWQARTD